MTQNYKTQDHLDALNTAIRDDRYGLLISHLFACLDSLDSKATAALTINGILFSAASLLIAKSGSAFSWNLLFPSVAFSFTAGLLCSYVIKVYWASMGDLIDLNSFTVKLSEIRSKRTLAYRLSLVLTAISMLLLVLGAWEAAD